MSDPAVQVMVNLVIDRGDEHILLVRYDADREEWWLPATEVAPYEHPDEAAERTLTELGVTDGEMSIANVQSFRGRRGWHLTFDYMVWTRTAGRRSAGRLVPSRRASSDGPRPLGRGHRDGGAVGLLT